MFEIEDLLTLAIAAFMPCDAIATRPYLDIAAGSAKAGSVAPVLTEGDETFRLFATISTQDPSHRTGQVVIAKRMKDATKSCERQLMSFEKRLLCGTRIGAMERCFAVHAAHREDPQLHPLPTEIGVGFILGDLRLCRWRISLRNEHVQPAHPQLPLAQLTYSRTRDRPTGNSGRSIWRRL